MSQSCTENSSNNKNGGFSKNSEKLSAVNYLYKNFILDVRSGSKYASVSGSKTFFKIIKFF